MRGVLYLKLSTNRGGAWGALGDAGPGFFIAASALFIAWLSIFIVRLSARDRAIALPLALLLGGFIGNGIDRLRLGHVVDFLYVTWYARGIPSTFNIADLAILGGLVWAIVRAAVRALRGRRIPED